MKPTSVLLLARHPRSVVCRVTHHKGLIHATQIMPAAGYAAGVAEHGGKVAVFNLERTDGDEDADFLFLGGCEETLPLALGLEPVLSSPTVMR